jgi:hypothetical protein
MRWGCKERYACGGEEEGKIEKCRECILAWLGLVRVHFCILHRVLGIEVSGRIIEEVSEIVKFV